MVNVAVIGAGVVGLSSATVLQERVPDATITIIANQFGNDTTSWGAGGLFRPTLKHIPGSSMETIKKWCVLSWHRFCCLSQSDQAKETGTLLVTGFMATDEMEDFFFKQLTINARDLSPEDMTRLKLPYRYGVSCTTVITEMKKYMPWMLKRFRDKGGRIEHRSLHSLNELAGRYDIAINCCGIGARELVNDQSVYPIRGQLVKVKAPWIKHWYLTSDDIYLIPHSDSLIIGGCRQKDNYKTQVSPEMSEEILRKAKKLFPQLKGAEVIGEWAGLRPARTPIRIEKERFTHQGRLLRVVHNYGHGSNGITLSWGTSQDAVDLVMEYMKEMKTSKL